MSIFALHIPYYSRADIMIVMLFMSSVEFLEHITMITLYFATSVIVKPKFQYISLTK